MQIFELGRNGEELRVRGVLRECGKFRFGFERFFERHFGIFGDELRDLVRILERYVEGPRHIFDDRLRLQRPEGDDLRHTVVAVLLADIVDDLAPALEVEVHVEVGHRDTLRVQEALENEFVFERVDVRDAHRVGDDGARARAAARAHRYAVLLRPVDKVPHDEEVAGKAHLRDDAELVFEPVLGLLARVSIARDKALAGDMRKVSIRRREGFGHLVVWKERPGKIDLEPRHLIDFERVLERLRHLGEGRSHLLGAL